MKFEKNGKQDTNLKRHNFGNQYVILILLLIIFAATIFSGGFMPVDPNGPGGPPTLAPYFGINKDKNEEQRIILPPEALTPDPKGKLQLKTFNVNVCAQKSAIDILIDTSGSMKDDNKIVKLKDALKEFTKSLSGTSAISIQTFSNVVTEKIPWGLYKNNNKKVELTINGLKANGWTRMRDGFTLSKTELSEAITQNKFPGYNYALLLISDGVPEIPPPIGTSPYNNARCGEPNYDPAPPGDTRVCYRRVCDNRTKPALRCFAVAQDPRTPTNIPDEIRNMGVPVYVIGLYSNITSDNKLRADLEPLLKNDIASKPTSAYYYAYNSADNPENLKGIFDRIVTKICEEAPK